MKTKIAIFSSLLVLCGANVSSGSECVGVDCDLGQIGYVSDVVATSVTETVPVQYAVAPVQYAAPAQYAYVGAVPMRSVKSLSIKPVPEDTRPALWDGTDANYRARGYDKTVDWRDGVPIWDDSIVNYKKKDFSDWFLEPLPEIYNRPVDAAPAMVPVAPVMPTMMSAPVYAEPQIDTTQLFYDTMEDAAATRARVEDLLNPIKPCGNLWTDDAAPVVTDTVASVDIAPAMCEPMMPRPEYVAQDMSGMISAAFGRSDGCPFDSETECNIWRRKPIIRETVSPRSSEIRMDAVQAIAGRVGCGHEVSANEDIAAPLLDRYKMLMRSARACCTEGMAYQLKRAGASDGLVYKFMSDDANFYGIGDRCLMMTDAELDEKYPNMSVAVVAADVRNGCLCRGRQWFNAMLAPFRQVYAAAPEFKNQKFYYTYTDGLQRRVTVSVNNDVQNVLNQLALCP